VNNLSVIDSFTDVFSRYIDSGFGLLHGEVAWLTGILVALDITLAGLFWAMGGHEDVIAKLIKKTLYVGAFAFILNNFNSLSGIIFGPSPAWGSRQQDQPLPKRSSCSRGG
jgi:type IV secretion system protein TrbL